MPPDSQPALLNLDAFPGLAACAALALVVTLSLDVVRVEWLARQTYPLIKCPGRCLVNQLAVAYSVATFLCAAILLFSFAIEPTLFLVGGIVGVLLGWMYWFRGIDLREHGLHAGTMFINWNSVATFKVRPGKKDDECLLTVRGRFLLPRRFKIRQCNASQIEKFIHGACRFEPQPLGRRLLLGGIGLGVRVAVFVCLFGLATYWLLGVDWTAW